ncbi:uncharacterized protein DUF2529 [Salsuginibacillus halophilus]|uniref:Uncharacterized protein DUF2529 n=1 Tax=Salsuginibacillus halophilus TaxID=517424 RepID=A0A2P8HHX1_9BACI|nr:DUF2529 family protein [Salsuginibacillus halophilus]PSL45822.1 uncharacterized protein DUF2529 [Salsuginibacillus halophilus]
MIKMFSTQLQGVFQKIQQEEEALEDGARLLAQAVKGSGTLYTTATPKAAGIEAAARCAADAPAGCTPFPDDNNKDFSPMDRVLIFSAAGEKEALTELLEQAAASFVPAVVIGPEAVDVASAEGVEAPIHIPTYATDGLVPDLDGSRFGDGTTLAGLYAFQLLALFIQDMLEDAE